MPSLSISYPYLIEFHGFAYNIQQGMKHQMGGATQAQLISHDIQFENQTGSHDGYLIRFSWWLSYPVLMMVILSGSHDGFQWKPVPVFNLPNTSFNHWFQFLDYFRIILQNHRTVGFDETLQNFIYKHTVDLENVQNE